MGAREMSVISIHLSAKQAVFFRLIPAEVGVITPFPLERRPERNPCEKVKKCPVMMAMGKKIASHSKRT